MIASAREAISPEMSLAKVFRGTLNTKMASIRPLRTDKERKLQLNAEG